MTSTILRLGLWTLIIILALYVIHESFEESPVAEMVPLDMLQKALIVGVALIVVGVILRVFDIGSAKPDAALRVRVPHHLFDIIEATEEFNAADYARLAHAVCEDINRRGPRAILVGGTFFYLRALLSGLPAMPGRDEETRRRLRATADQPRGPERLHRWLSKIDPQSGRKIPSADRHRVERALEVWLASGKPISSWERPAPDPAAEIPAVKIALTLERQRPA